MSRRSSGTTEDAGKARCDVASSRAPTNIAVIKYWGKDVGRGGNTPINSSCSWTLDPEDLRAETVIVASEAFEEDALYLNGRWCGTSGDSTHAKRLRKCLATMRGKCTSVPEGSSATSAAELASWKVRVVSRNTFPTAAGLASSAAGYAALVVAAARLYGVSEAFPGELSTIARVGSGSACRSLYGGLVAWHKGSASDCLDSRAEQFFDEGHWPELRVVVLVANAAEKDTPSTEGMALSVDTSPFLAHRAATVAEPRIEQLRAAVAAKDFEAFADLCMRDSNSFHATCLDTYPPIFYMDHTSRAVIKAVHAFNDFYGRKRVAYTFDAGPNAVCFCEDQAAADAFVALAARILAPPRTPCNKPDHLRAALRAYPAPDRLVDACGGRFYLGAAVKMIYLTKIGAGAQAPLSGDALATLVDPDTLEPVLAQSSQSLSLSRAVLLGSAVASVVALLARRRAA